MEDLHENQQDTIFNKQRGARPCQEMDRSHAPEGRCTWRAFRAMVEREEDTMEPTLPGTDFRLPRHHRYPSMTGEERLKALRTIRGMWKGQGKAIMQRIEAGREDRTMPAAKD